MSYEKAICRNVNREAEKAGLQKEKPKADTRKNLKQDTIWSGRERKRIKHSCLALNISHPAQSFVMSHHTIAFRFPEIPLDLFCAYSKFLPFIQASDFQRGLTLRQKPNLSACIYTLIFLQITDSLRKKIK